MENSNVAPMADISETSDLNSDEVARMVEDIDNLDKELFGTSFKKSVPSAQNTVKISNPQPDVEAKKKVIFKDHDETDPLADLLSDEEDYSAEKRNPIVPGAKSSLMEDLFKIKTSASSVTITKSDSTLNSKFDPEVEKTNSTVLPRGREQPIVTNESFTAPRTKAPMQRSTQKAKNVPNDKEDVLGDLLDKSAAVDQRSKKASLIEDLFDSRSRSFHNTTKAEVEVARRPAVQPPSAMQPPTFQPPNNPSKLSATREPRRGRRNSKIINDPLGLLSTDFLSDQGLGSGSQESVQTKDPSAQDTNTEKNLPEWLGGSKKLENKKIEATDEAFILKNESSENPANVPKENIQKQSIVNPQRSMISDENSLEVVHSHPEHFSLLMSTQFNQQAAIMSMQQQEHELRTATVLSEQNDQLNKVLDVQRSRFDQQEKQFNALLKMQLERQALIEKQMKTQQDRIDYYIQTMMAQPISVTTPPPLRSSNFKEAGEEAINKSDDIEKLVDTLQLEKSELESTLRTLNERHLNEITIQEESYRRQISFLEETMAKLEKRARQEIEFLEADYLAKLEKLRDEKTQAERLYKDEISSLKVEHTRHIEELYEQHSQNLRHLQKEHSETIENISKAKQVENLAIEAMTNRKADLQNTLEKVNSIIESVKESQEKMELRHDKETKSREEYLMMQEDDIKMQKLEIERQKNILEEKHSKLIEATETLNVRLVQLVTQLQNQSTRNADTEETLAKNRSNLMKERELFEEKMQWERNYLQALKESWIKEQERQLESLAKEKEAVAAEKAQLEVLSRLRISSDDAAKIELESAIKTAQDAILSANREKLRWQEKINELEVKQQNLQSKENLLVLHARELENLTQSALIKREEGIKALKDAKHLEGQHKEKISQMQMQLDTLIQREKKIAAERFSVVRDRVISRTSKAEKPERDAKTNIVHSFLDEPSFFSDMRPISQNTTQFMDIVDPNLLMLKLNLDDQLDTSNKYLQVLGS